MILTHHEEGLEGTAHVDTDAESMGEDASDLENRAHRVRRRAERSSRDLSFQEEPTGTHHDPEDDTEVVPGGALQGDFSVGHHGLLDWQTGHMFPGATFENQCMVLRPEHPGEEMQLHDVTYAMFNFPANPTIKTPWKFTDQDAIGHLGQSRIPHRVAFQVHQARIAIEKEITDLLQSRPGHHPATIQVALGDPHYRHLTRVSSTLVFKRKSVDLYKGRLCTRGDVAPLTVASFTSIPTAHRSGVEIL